MCKIIHYVMQEICLFESTFGHSGEYHHRVYKSEESPVPVRVPPLSSIL